MPVLSRWDRRYRPRNAARAGMGSYPATQSTRLRGRFWKTSPDMADDAPGTRGANAKCLKKQKRPRCSEHVVSGYGGSSVLTVPPVPCSTPLLRWQAPIDAGMAGGRSRRVRLRGQPEAPPPPSCSLSGGGPVHARPSAPCRGWFSWCPRNGRTMSSVCLPPSIGRRTAPSIRSRLAPSRTMCEASRPSCEAVSTRMS